MSIYLIAAHLFGDFILQSRWVAAAKLHDWRVRIRHVLIYSLPFWPIAVFFHRYAWGAGVFMVLLVVLHFITDSYRFKSSLGDWIEWHLNKELRLFMVVTKTSTVTDPTDMHEVIDEFEVGETPLDKLPPNPWAPLPIILDQSLHICQIAFLAGVFLR